MANIVPLQAAPSQNVITTLSGQIVQLKIYSLRYGMFIDVYVNGVLEIGAVLCENLNRIIRTNYLNATAGFAGDFVFSDQQGDSDPVYSGLGTRFLLLYLTPADLAALGAPDT